MTVHQLGMMTDLELDATFRRLCQQWADGGQTRRVVVGRLLDAVLDEAGRRAEARVTA